MSAADVKVAFPSEAALCDCFIESLREIGGWTVYPETAGFDILAVYDKTGHQLGVEAKLKLNAKVADQILPEGQEWDVSSPGPDFRAVIVPCITEASYGIAKMLGILGVQVWAPEEDYDYRSKPAEWASRRVEKVWHFCRALDRHFCMGIGGNRRGQTDARQYDSSSGTLTGWDLAWHDWNPPKRCELPEIVPQVRAGVPAPLQLTPWKIGALKVLADLELDGFVTAKSVRHHGVDSRRFCASDGWLESLGDGRWGRGRIPRFDEQHPEAYAEILATARAFKRAAKP